MKKRKHREIIAKFLLVIVLLAMPGVQGSMVYAEDDEEETPPYVRVDVNTRRGIVEERDFGDLHIGNISLIKYVSTQGYANQCTLTCDVTNMGSRKFKGMLRLHLYDGSGSLMIEMFGYFGDELPPGATRTITSSTNLDLMSAVSLSIQKKSWQNKGINTSAIFDNVLEMYNIGLFPNYDRDKPEYWEMRFQLKALDYTIPDVFQLNVFFRNELGEIEYQASSLIKGETVRDSYHNAIAMYGGEDLSNICSIEISADFPSPAPGQTAKPTPTGGVEKTAAPQPTRDVSATTEPVSTLNSPATAEPSLPPETSPTERPAGTQTPGETASTAPSPTLSPTAKPSAAPIPTAQQPTQTKSPEETVSPTAPPTAKPTQTPSVQNKKPAESTAGTSKLIRPVIQVKIRKIDKKVWMAEIRLKKYQGTDVQIYYRRGKGKFKKIKLRRHNIKKNKKIFKVGYKKGRKIIYLRVRTYQKKGGKKWYSRYSKIRRLS